MVTPLGESQADHGVKMIRVIRGLIELLLLHYKMAYLKICIFVNYKTCSLYSFHNLLLCNNLTMRWIK